MSKRETCQYDSERPSDFFYAQKWKTHKCGSDGKVVERRIDLERARTRRSTLEDLLELPWDIEQALIEERRHA